MDGKKVIITDTRTQEAQDAFEYLNERGYDVCAIPEDICLWDEAVLSGFAQKHADEMCAVIHPLPPLISCGFEQADEALFSRVRDEGPLAAWCVTKVFGGIFRENHSGSIIYLGSIHAEKPVGRGFLYSSVCAAVQMLQREANQDYGVDGVHTYYIQRGITADDPDARSDVSPLYYGVDIRYPERHMPQRGELNALIEFLLTPGAAPLSGSDLRADGGMTMFYNHRHRVEGRDYYGRP